MVSISLQNVSLNRQNVRNVVEAMRVLLAQQLQKKCTNCGGSHNANWQGCPSYKTQKAANYVKTTEGISYAAALTKVKILADTIKPKPQPLQPATKQTQEGDPRDPYVRLS